MSNDESNEKDSQPIEDRQTIFAAKQNDQFIASSNQTRVGDQRIESRFTVKSALHNAEGDVMYDFNRDPDYIANATGPKFNDIALKSLRNGYYQHIFFIGVCGFVVVNHHDKEILLLDTWPSYSSPWAGEVPMGQERKLYITPALLELVNGPGGLRSNITDDLALNGSERKEPYFTIVESMETILNGGQETRRPMMQRIMAMRSLDSGAGDPGMASIRREILQRMESVLDEPDRGVPRLLHLVNFLRRSVSDSKYTITGILLSHMHYDHAEDIPFILQLLSAPEGRHLEWGLTFDLEGQPIQGTLLPKIYCDYDTMFYLKAMYFGMTPSSVNTYFKKICDGSPKLREFVNTYQQNLLVDLYGNTDEKWELVTLNNTHPIYNDYYNNEQNESERLKAGLQADDFTVGHFTVTPYIWDHMNTGNPVTKDDDYNPIPSAGSYQRITAFLIQHATAPNAKKSFFIGSSGSMDEKYTKNPVDIDIECDVLFTAITGQFYWHLVNLTDQGEAAWRYILRNVSVKDFIVFCHWDHFVRHVSVDENLKSNAEYEFLTFQTCRDMNIVEQNFSILDDLEDDDMSGQFKTSPSYYLRQGKIYIMQRRLSGFESPLPANTEELLTEFRTGEN